MVDFPRWKYFLVFAIVVLGFIYAAPNIYEQDPGVQVAGTEGVLADQSTLKTITTLLQKNKLPYKSAGQTGENQIVVRFHDVETQLKSREIIKAGLDNRYTVALNTLDTVPRWLSALGAAPMNLGLDLRGGVHFLLEVDVDSVIKKRTSGDMRDMSKSLRDARIRYSGVTQNNLTEIQLSFNDKTIRDDAFTLLKKRYTDYMLVKLDHSDQALVIANLSIESLQKMRKHAMEQTMTVLRNRVNELGITEPVVQQQGKNRIVVDLPGIQDAAQAEQILGGTATLEFHIVDDSHSLSSAIAGQIPFGSSLHTMKDGSKILLKNQIVLSGQSIVSASSNFDDRGRPAVNIRIAGSEVNYFGRVTKENVGRRMGIVYVESKMDVKLDGDQVVRVPRRIEYVISAPVIQSALPASFQITGLTDMEEARNLALLLRAGALPANIYPVEQSVVGPSLGKENIEKGVLSVEIGFLLIVVFMLVYYRYFGFVANLALGLNLVLLVAALSLLGATLTLPGIAGIVLTVGMAVDANVLINERIREELRNGLSNLAAIRAGYDRAFATIVDANITTLIVAIVLFAVGSGSVKGFAVTLTIGLVTSMFTAITGTRAIIMLTYGNKPGKRLSIGI